MVFRSPRIFRKRVKRPKFLQLRFRVCHLIHLTRSRKYAHSRAHKDEICFIFYIKNRPSQPKIFTKKKFKFRNFSKIRQKMPKYFFYSKIFIFENRMNASLKKSICSICWHFDIVRKICSIG